MPELVVRRGALAPAPLATLREALLGSPLVSRSTLAGSFRGSRGFAITFTAAGQPELLRRFPFVAPFLALALGEPDALRPWPLRWLGGGPRTNAYYLNLLLLADGGAVGRHVDATLRQPSGVADAVPARVSVLYLEVPPGGGGGELRLFRDNLRRGVVRPVPGALVHFRGDLAHEVTALSDVAEGALRASLVLEQYALPEAAAARMSPLHVQSKAGFQAYLQDHKRLEPQGEQEGDRPVE